jgi:hypothetical protein
MASNWGKNARAKHDSSLKSLEVFVAYIAGSELIQVYKPVNHWLASLVGIGLGCAVMYIEPPRPQLKRVLLVFVPFALVLVVLYFLHIG